jgi:hypothetical protein
LRRRHILPETSHSICKATEAYWHLYGGVAEFGYSISEPLTEKSQTDGKNYTVQYFERSGSELHTENPPGLQVALGSLGNMALAQYGKWHAEAGQQP